MSNVYDNGYKFYMLLRMDCLSRYTLIGVGSFNMLKTSADGKRKICDPEFMPQVYEKCIIMKHRNHVLRYM